jgi:hypothetical protein
MDEALVLVAGALISFLGFSYAIRSATQRRWKAYVLTHGRRSPARVLTLQASQRRTIDLTLDPGDGGKPVFVWGVSSRAGLEPGAMVSLVYDERTRVGMLDGS